jgi:hypothetical protein
VHRLAAELFEQLVAEILQDGRRLAFAPGGANHEVIGDQRDATNIEEQDVAGLFVGREVDDAAREAKRFGAILRLDLDKTRFAGYV